MQPVNEEGHLQSSSSYGSYGGYSHDRRKGFGRRAQTMEIDELLDPAESIELLIGVPPMPPLPPKTQKKFAGQQLDSIESDSADGTHGTGAVGGAATMSSTSTSAFPSTSAAAASSGRASAPPLQRQRTNEEPEHSHRPSIRILITPSSVNEMHRIEQDDKNAAGTGGGAGGGGGALGGSVAASDTTSSPPDTTRPQGQLLEPPTYVKRTHPRMKSLERSMSVAHDDQRRGPLAWRLNKQKSLNECDIVMALDPATPASVEAAQSSKGVSFRVHWGRRISSMLGHGWTSLSGSGMVGGIGVGGGGGGAAGGQQENTAPASRAQGPGEVAAEEPSSQTEGDVDMTTGLKEQIYSFFQATDNKLSLKLYGNRGAVLREKVRQQLVGPVYHSPLF